MNLSPETRTTLKQLLIKHEEYRKFPHIDKHGNVKIGIGDNLSLRGVPDSWIQERCDDMLDFCWLKLNQTFTWFENLSVGRQVALMNMAYGLGWKPFLSFKRMFQALEEKDYSQAAYEMLDSNWSHMVGKRADELAEMILGNK